MKRRLFWSVIVVLACLIWFVLSVERALWYGDEYQRWKYETTPPGLVPPSPNQINYFDTLCTRWAISAASAFVVGAVSSGSGIVLLVLWLGRRKREPPCGFQVVQTEDLTQVRDIERP